MKSSSLARHIEARSERASTGRVLDRGGKSDATALWYAADGGRFLAIIVRLKAPPPRHRAYPRTDAERGRFASAARPESSRRGAVALAGSRSTQHAACPP